MQTTDTPSEKNLLLLLQENGENNNPRIYSYKSITTALFRSLNSFEQSTILKLLSSDTLKLETLITSEAESQELLETADLKLCKQLKIVEKFSKGINEPSYYKLNPFFAKAFKEFLVNGFETIFQVQEKKLEKCIKQAEQFTKKLRNLALDGWSNLYRTMLRGYMSTDFIEIEELTENMKNTLEGANLTLKSSRSHKAGFDFLLDSVKNQVGILLHCYCRYIFRIKYKYLKNVETKEAVTEGSILNLLFNMTLLPPTVGYSVKNSSENFKKMGLPENLIQDVLNDLNCVGLITVSRNDNNRVKAFATTPLIFNALNGNSALQEEFKNNIIVETDFMVYAYTQNSDFLYALLNLFLVIKARFPGLLVCSIEEEKIVEAFDRGINPNQILRYLNSNAHKKVVERRIGEMSEEELENSDRTYAFIPENIAQQIFIWFTSRDREEDNGN